MLLHVGFILLDFIDCQFLCGDLWSCLFTSVYYLKVDLLPTATTCLVKHWALFLWVACATISRVFIHFPSFTHSFLAVYSDMVFIYLFLLSQSLLYFLYFLILPSAFLALLHSWHFCPPCPNKDLLTAYLTGIF